MTKGDVWTPQVFASSTSQRHFLGYQHDTMPHGPIRTYVEYQAIYKDGSLGPPTRDLLKSWNSWVFKHSATCVASKPEEVPASAESAGRVSDVALAQERKDTAMRNLSVVFARAFTEVLEVMQACGNVELPGVQEWRTRNLEAIREHVKVLDQANQTLGQHTAPARI